MAAEEEDINAQLECRSSLIFLTHPTVVEEYEKLASQPISMIKTPRGVIEWSTDDSGKGPFLKDSIHIQINKHILIFKGPVKEAEFVSNLQSKEWNASIFAVKRPSAEKKNSSAAVVIPEYSKSIKPGHFSVSERNGTFIAQGVGIDGDAKMIVGDNPNKVSKEMKNDIEKGVIKQIKPAINTINKKITKLYPPENEKDAAEIESLKEQRGLLVKVLNHSRKNA